MPATGLQRSLKSPSHPCTIAIAKFPLEVFMKYVHILSKERGQHWMIKESAYIRENIYGHSFLKRRIKPSVQNDFINSAEFCIQRALMEYIKGPYPLYTSLTNKCGLPQCVNPDHWNASKKSLKDSPIWNVFTAINGDRSFTHIIKKNININMLYLQIKQEGIIHSLIVPPKEIYNIQNQPKAVCGIILDLMSLCSETAQITCKNGC